MTTDTDQAALKRTLELELARVKTPEDAERIVSELERLAAGTTEGQEAAKATRDPALAAQEVQRAAEQATGPRREVAAVLAETAKQTAQPTREGEAVLEAAQEVLKPAPAAAPSPVEPDAAWGAELLKNAVLRHLGPVQALDAKVFLAINRAPHPAWSDRAGRLIATWTTGGWIWAAGLLVARLFGSERAGRALLTLLPCITVATTTVEYPVKAFFRRKRPFIDVVRALVVGKKPGSWSFPSGHTASSFGAAWTLSTIWPSRAPFFFALAAAVGFSRIYVGAHYPGDVTSGAFCGMTLAELTRQVLKHTLLQESRLWR
ncbi:MAG TPA: phosphatase PAP2 family protein [Chloroflexota bacterium]|nr:phosphatase PAP2 family protein [Chloroflexota bacterium]